MAPVIAARANVPEISPCQIRTLRVRDLGDLTSTYGYDLTCTALGMTTYTASASKKRIGACFTPKGGHAAPTLAVVHGVAVDTLACYLGVGGRRNKR